MSGALLYVGATVRVTRPSRGLDVETRLATSYYLAGTKARLLRKTSHGWWCSFRDQGNPFGSFKFNRLHSGMAEWFVPHSAMVLA